MGQLRYLHEIFMNAAAVCIFITGLLAVIACCFHVADWALTKIMRSTQAWGGVVLPAMWAYVAKKRRERDQENSHA